MAYEVFTRQMPGLSSPAVTNLRAGRISFNLGAQNLAQDHKLDRVLLLSGKRVGKIALKAW